MLGLLRDAAEAGKTVIIATHDPFVKESCRYVFDVSEGVVV